MKKSNLQPEQIPLTLSHADFQNLSIILWFNQEILKSSPTDDLQALITGAVAVYACECRKELTDSHSESLTNYSCQYLDQCNQAIRELAEQSLRAQG